MGKPPDRTSASARRLSSATARADSASLFSALLASSAFKPSRMRPSMTVWRRSISWRARHSAQRNRMLLSRLQLERGVQGAHSVGHFGCVDDAGQAGFAGGNQLDVDAEIGRDTLVTPA